MSYYRDLRGFLAELEKRGKVHRFSRPLDKDSEIMSLARLQFRGFEDAERRVLLFESVTDAAGRSFDMSIATGVYGGSEEILALGLGCEKPEEMLRRWVEIERDQIEPVVVESGAVHEVIHVGDALLERGLDIVPAPVEEVGFSQVIRTGLPMITRDPSTGTRNMGTYNGFFRSRNRLVAGINIARPTMRVHWQNARERGEGLPAAIVVGCTPNIMIASSATVPYGVDELAIAGGIAGRPVELVKCLTVPLEVPAEAEMVIEGVISTETLEPTAAFGEYPGYMNTEQNFMPIMEVTAITHRQDPIFTPVFVGFPPSDTNAISEFCKAALLYKQLRHDSRLPVADVYLPQEGGGAMCFFRLEEDAPPGAARQVLDVASGLSRGLKYLVAVDCDIDVRDPGMVFWALSFRTRPQEDIVIHAGRFAGLDPSFGPTGSSKGAMASHGQATQHFKVMIDATRTGPYPPVALPRRQYMERALDIWRQESGLEEPKLREPWYGYELGYWDENHQQLADLMVEGKYLEVGSRMAQQQARVDDVLGPGRL